LLIAGHAGVAHDGVGSSRKTLVATGKIQVAARDSFPDSE